MALPQGEADYTNLYHSDILIASPLAPDGHLCNSYEEAYELWKQAFSMYNSWTMVKRAIRCWNTIKVWLLHNFPEALDTLNGGACASEEDLNEAETRLGVEIPKACRILYRLCDGQDVVDRPHGDKLGIVGGYSAYTQTVNVHLLPLRRMERVGNDYITVAESSPPNKPKAFFIDCCEQESRTRSRTRSRGQLFVSTKNGGGIECAQGNLDGQSILSWLEQLYNRLQTGALQIRGIGPRSIILFPEAPDDLSITIENFVEVRASAVFMPECSVEDGSYEFAYSVRMRLLEGAPFRFCQLNKRTWRALQQGSVTNRVTGADGVRGQHPILERGGPEFCYESRTILPNSPSGSMDGVFTFIPGSLAHPLGEEFGVDVDSFPLQQLPYIW